MNIVEKIVFRIQTKKYRKNYYNDRKTYHVTYISKDRQTVRSFYSNSLKKIKLIGFVISRINRKSYVCTYIWKNKSANDFCVQRWDIKGSFDHRSGLYREGYIYDRKTGKFKLYYGDGS